MSLTGQSPPSKRRSAASGRLPPSLPRLEDLPSRRLAADHDASAFLSGNEYLDEWLRLFALNADNAGNSRTWVWAPDGRTVVGYYSLAPHLVFRERLPKRVARGSQDEIPAILLARLALAEGLHGQGLGKTLLADALTRILHTVEIVGGRLVVVDAVDETAAEFYERFGFIRASTDPIRLVIKASTVRKSV
jgi:GNAT superfamily N-acetyltransferase